MNPPKWSFNFDVQHYLVLAGSTVVGAVVGYLQSQQPGTIIDALGSWTTFKPMLFGMLSAATVSLISLGKQKAPPAGGAS